MTKTRVALLTKRPQHNEIRLAALQEIAAKKNLLEFEVADLEQEPEEIIAAFQGARILIALNIKPTNFIATKLPDLKLLQTFSAGTDQLDLALLLQHGIEVANNGGANAVSVAEHAIMLMLTPHLATRVIQSEWNADMNAVENAERIAQGFKPNWIVDPV